MTSTLIPNFRILSTNWTVANISFTDKSCAGTLIIYFNYFYIWHVSFDLFARDHPRQTLSYRPDFALEIFSNSGPSISCFCGEAVLMVGRTCPARRALLARWSFPYVWSWRLIRPSVRTGLHLQHSKRSSWELLAILSWLGTQNSFCQQWLQTYLWQ